MYAWRVHLKRMYLHIVPIICYAPLLKDDFSFLKQRVSKVRPAPSYFFATQAEEFVSYFDS